MQSLSNKVSSSIGWSTNQQFRWFFNVFHPISCQSNYNKSLSATWRTLYHWKSFTKRHPYSFPLRMRELRQFTYLKGCWHWDLLRLWFLGRDNGFSQKLCWDMPLWHPEIVKNTSRFRQYLIIKDRILDLVSIIKRGIAWWEVLVALIDWW